MIDNPREILRISEIFTSIQGEGRDAGRPMQFVRLAGCNLKCIYCDTKFAKNSTPTDYKTSELIEILNERSDLPVYVTGGEPLIQSATQRFMDELVMLGYEVFLDTNGTRDLKVVNKFVGKIVDIKTPGSLSGGEFRETNIEYISRQDEIKFVVTSKDDFDWGIQRVKKWNLFDRTYDIFFQPAWDLVDPKELAKWIISCHLPVRLSLQMHKYIWGPDARGV